MDVESCIVLSRNCDADAQAVESLFDADRLSTAEIIADYEARDGSVYLSCCNVSKCHMVVKLPLLTLHLLATGNLAGQTSRAEHPIRSAAMEQPGRGGIANTPWVSKPLGQHLMPPCSLVHSQCPSGYCRPHAFAPQPCQASVPQAYEPHSSGGHLQRRHRRGLIAPSEPQRRRRPED